MKFNLFDTVKLTQKITLNDGGIANMGTVGTIVEIFNQDEAYLIELFGNWVKYDHDGNFINTFPNDQNAFVETIGIETVYPEQLELVKSAKQTISKKAYLLTVVDNLSEESLIKIIDFAEFVQFTQQQTQVLK